MDRSSGPDSRERPGAFFAPGRPALTSGPPVRLIRTDTRHSRPTSGPSRAVCQKTIVMQCFFARRPGRPGSAYQSPARAARADPTATNRKFLYHFVLHCNVERYSAVSSRSSSDTSVALLLYPGLRPNHPFTQQDGDFLFLRLARCSRHSAVVVSRARFRCCVVGFRIFLPIINSRVVYFYPIIVIYDVNDVVTYILLGLLGCNGSPVKPGRPGTSGHFLPTPDVRPGRPGAKKCSPDVRAVCWGRLSGPDRRLVRTGLNKTTASRNSDQQLTRER